MSSSVSPNPLPILKKPWDLLLLIWALAFLSTSILYSSGTHYHFGGYLFFAALGWGLVLASHKEDFLEFLKTNKAIWIPLILFSLAILVSEIWNEKIGGNPYTNRSGYPAALIWCWPPLAWVAQRVPLLEKIFFGFFAVLTFYFFIAIPIEAFTAIRINWHGNNPVVGGFGWQAAGLAFSRVYFVGFYSPMAFWVFGKMLEGQPLLGTHWNKKFVSFLAVLWIFIVVCAASRSGVIGGVLTSFLVFYFVFGFKKFVGLLILFVGSVFLAKETIPYIELSLLSNYAAHSSARWQMIVFYVQKSLEWPHWLLGHGAYFDRASKGLYDPPSVGHSHNDFAEILFVWGLPALLLYITALLVFLKKQIPFWRKTQNLGPLLCILAALPNFHSDLGFNHFEKAHLVGFLFCFAYPFWIKNNLHKQ